MTKHAFQAIEPLWLPIKEAFTTIFYEKCDKIQAECMQIKPKKQRDERIEQLTIVRSLIADDLSRLNGAIVFSDFGTAHLIAENAPQLWQKKIESRKNSRQDTFDQEQVTEELFQLCLLKEELVNFKRDLKQRLKVIGWNTEDIKESLALFESFNMTLNRALEAVSALASGYYGDAAVRKIGPHTQKIMDEKTSSLFSAVRAYA